MATHSSILAWRIPRIEESGGLQSIACKESDTIEVTAHYCEMPLTVTIKKNYLNYLD